MATAKQTPLDLLKKKYLRARYAYYNDDSSGLTDAEFDRLEDKIRAQDPAWSELKKTGVAVANKKREVALVHFMPSLNKAYPEAIGKWIAKYPSNDYIVMDKLDGSSLQVVYLGGKLTQVVTRGDGTHGGDITFLGQHLNLPNSIKSKSLTVFRCEAIIKREVFDRRWASEFDNPRNMVNGLLNRKTPHKALRDVDIVVLGCYGLSLVAGRNLAKLEGLCTVSCVGIPSDSAHAEKMTDLLNMRKDKSIYDIDGLVIAPYDWMFNYKNADKPKGVIAFKVNTEDETIEAQVQSVVWQISGRGRIIPKVEIKPTELGGVTVTYCTSHNAVWLMERKIGPGAVIKLVRSGGVIPKIVGVTKPAKRMLLPDVPYTTQGVHFVVSKASSDTKKLVQVEKTLKFMTTLGVEFLAARTIETAYKVLATPLDYLRSWHSARLATDLVSVGVGGVMARKIQGEFDRLFSCEVPILKMMVASQTFGAGIGERKLQQLVNAGISLTRLTASLSDDQLWGDRIRRIHGFSDKTTELLLVGLGDWRYFHDEVTQYVRVSEPKLKQVKTGAWSKHKVSFTGYRDKQHEAAVVARGGEVVPFGAKTTVLFIREGGKASSKVDKAREKGLTVTTFENFKP